jgi:glycosyltransferase involved in cell wall biosynthesis
VAHLSVVIPVLNEESTITDLVERVSKSSSLLSDNFEIIIIDDGSTDSTWKRIEEIGEKNSKLKGLKFSRNFGHHYAITAGIAESSGDWVVVMDGDLQDRPEVIPDLYNKAQEGYDVVFVSRTQRPESLLYRISQKIFYFILRFLSGIKFDNSQANFSIINKKVVESFKEFPENARFYGSTVMWLGYNRASIKAAHGIRVGGKPSYTLKKRLKLASDIILAFSDRPLKFAIAVGILMSTFSFFILFYIIWGSLNWGFSSVGWASLMATTLLTGGAILIVLGIIGVYIGSIFREVKSRPLYLIDKKYNF